jgi:Zn-dependent protease
MDVFKYFLEGVLETKGMVEVKAAEVPFVLTREELFPLSFAGVTLALAFSYSLAPTAGDILLLLPVTLATAVLIELSKELARELVARRTGNWSEYRIWPLGLICMVVSTVLFRAPFSVPGKSWFYMSSPSKRSEGMIATASSVVGFLAAGVFFVLVLMGARTLGSMGLSVSLALALYELIPTSPLNGKAVFDWNKAVWTVLFAAALILYGLQISALI